MNKYSNYNYPLETIFDYNQLDAIITQMNLQHNKKVYAHYKDRNSLYELIFSKENKKLKITPAKHQCYTCNYAEDCACIVYGACDDGRDFCKAELRAWEMFDCYVMEKLSEESIFFVKDCLGCPVCSHCLG